MSTNAYPRFNSGKIVPEMVEEGALSGVKCRHLPAGSVRSARHIKRSSAPSELRQELTCKFQIRRLKSLPKSPIAGLEQVSSGRRVALAGPQSRKPHSRPQFEAEGRLLFCMLQGALERPFGSDGFGGRCLKPYLATDSQQFGFVQGFAKRLT